jgi:hypothetical protein
MNTPKTKGGPAGNTGTALTGNECFQIPAHGLARKSLCDSAQAHRPEASPPGPALARPDPGPRPSLATLALCLPVTLAARLGPQPGLNAALALIPAILEEVRR